MTVGRMEIEAIEFQKGRGGDKRDRGQGWKQSEKRYKRQKREISGQNRKSERQRDEAG